ncbi:MAG: hypothetical protein ABI904_04515 [Chloroflexota bacterium]
MNKNTQDAQDYLKAELDFFQKEKEIQFTHFMGVFYFWTAIVTAPITAGLLTTGNLKSGPLPILLLVVAIVGMFLTLKMYDIRCSQLIYTDKMNKTRGIYFIKIKEYLPESYKLPYLPDENLRGTALKDFGMWMARIMSLMNSVILFFALLFLFERYTGFLVPGLASFLFFLFGVRMYKSLVEERVSDGTKHE